MLLEKQPDMEVVAETAGGNETIHKTLELHPDVVVLDITMPDMNGLEALQRIHEERPNVQILVLTMHEDERYFFQAMKAGASGYVVKGAPPLEFITAVRSVAEGQAYLPPALAKKLLDDYTGRRENEGSEESCAGLTDRERQVLQLFAEGRTGANIAATLRLSPHTVERHRQKLMAKLGLHNRAALIRYAIRKRLVEIDE
jgi:two-component system response regulator NreC